jgi:hypothetical protein
MNRSQTIKRIASAAIVAGAAAGAYVLACGPFLIDLRTVATVYPAHLEQYGRGHLGVVRPHFARRYLVQAYRRFSGQPALRNVVPPAPVSNDPPVPTPLETWQDERAAPLGAEAGGAAPPPILTYRRVGDYQSIENCLDGGFLSAVATLKARAARFGASSPVTRDWIKAQDAVFYNCAGDPFVAPASAAPSADPLVRADRAYQIAAAHFYATHYDEAIQRFRAIAADAASPWRPYGRYMAARALIRQGTVPEVRQTAPLLAAEAELRRVIEDPAAASLHASARGLIDFIAVRVRPAERLRELSAVLTRERTVANQQILDYERLMDGFVGDTTTYVYDEVPERIAVAQSADLNDWVLAMQGTGAAATSRALAKWKDTRSLPWLAAALWRVPAANADSGALLEAAARVDPSSPAFATLSFLRVRLLAAAGRREEARAVLATLPSKPGDGVESETVNLFLAERFMLADSMAELLANAPRDTIPEEVTAGIRQPLISDAPRQPVFDNDAGDVFSKRMPLARLVEAATSRALPERLRLRVAAAAFARAWLLRRDDAAVAVAPVLRSLSPPVRADVERFEAAPTPEARRIAGLRLLLRTPGIRANVKGLEDDNDYYTQRELRRQFDHVFQRDWWCGADRDGYERERADSELIEVLYGGKEVPFPAFVTAVEQAAVQRERAAILALGAAPTYLAREAVKWAQAQPADAGAAEALAHAVEGTRWGCTDRQSSAASRAAFQTLHRLFPRSEWARKTRYWY